jgi:hypothetical protein
MASPPTTILCFILDSPGSSFITLFWKPLSNNTKLYNTSLKRGHFLEVSFKKLSLTSPLHPKVDKTNVPHALFMSGKRNVCAKRFKKGKYE